MAGGRASNIIPARMAKPLPVTAGITGVLQRRSTVNAYDDGFQGAAYPNTGIPYPEP